MGLKIDKVGIVCGENRNFACSIYAYYSLDFEGYKDKLVDEQSKVTL